MSSNYLGRWVLVTPLDGSEPFEDEIIGDFIGSHLVTRQGIEVTYNGDEAIPYNINKGYVREPKYNIKWITKKMKESEVKVGAPVWYHPTIDEPEREAAVITSGIWNVGGTPCCKIDIRSGCVAIEALEKR